MGWAHARLRDRRPFYRLDARPSAGVPPPDGLGLFGGFATIEQNAPASLPADPLTHLKRSNRRLSVAYGSSWGTAPILFVETPEERLALARVAEQAASSATGLRRLTAVPSPDHPEPLYVACHQCAQGRPALDLGAELSRAAVTQADFTARLAGGVTNYMTTMFHVDVARQANGLGASLDVDALAALAGAVRALSGKDHYLSIVRGAGVERTLPLAPTAVVDVRELLGRPAPRWPVVRSRLDGADVALVLKPCVSGGGDGITVVKPGNERSLEQGLRLVARYADTGLAQAKVDPPDDGELPSTLGASLFIGEDGRVRVVGVARQLFAHPFGHKLVASDWVAAVEERVLDRVGDGLIDRGAALAAAGLRGPFGLDLVLDRVTASYVDIADLNPRLTGAGPLWQCRDLLTAHGAPVERMTMLPLDGAADHDLLDVARHLDRSGALYNPARRSGVWLLPSLVGPSHFQAFAVNMEAAARRLLHAQLAHLVGARPPVLSG